MKATSLIVAGMSVLALSGLAYGGERPAPAVPFGAEQIAGDSGGKPADGPIVASIGDSGMLAGGNRLVATQNSDGGWGWPLTGTSALNTVGPIGTGLAKVYRATGDAGMLAALGKVSTYLLAKTNNFSPSDGYLAAELDAVLGVTTHVEHLNANFYGPLAAGTYNKDGAGTLYDTAGYVNLVRTRRSGGQANLAAWDVGMGLVGAASCGVGGAQLEIWIAGVEAEIDELAAGDYDVIGLAGALYGLAYVNRDFDPTAGLFADAASLSDLASILVTYQLSTGGFTWSTTAMEEGQGNETIQETAYAVMALNALNGYREQVNVAVNYVLGVQLATGGWEDWTGAGENNEVTAEALWGVFLANNVLELNVSAPSLYVRPGESVVLDMDAKNLLQMVDGCQALLGYSSAFFNAGSVAPGGGAWTELIYESWTMPGQLDTAIGVKLEGGPAGTQGDGTVAVITLTAKPNDGVTQLVFRPDGANGYATMFSDLNHRAVMPAKVNSQDIVVDGTPPALVTVPADGTSNPVSAATQTITGTASDATAGIDTLVYTLNGGAPVPVTVTSGAFSVTVVLVPGANQVVFTLTDKAGNTATSMIDFTYTQPAPTINLYRSLAPNKYGSPSWATWLSNAITGARDQAGPVGSTEYTTFADFGDADQDYSSVMVTAFHSWKGRLSADPELGTAVHSVWRLDNGVRTNPGAAKLDVTKIAIAYHDIWLGADGPGDDLTTDYSGWWNDIAATASFGATSGFRSALKGFDWDGSAWVEVTSGTQADLIVYAWFRYAQQPTDNPPTPDQSVLNGLYKEMSGALPFGSDPRRTLDRQELEVKYEGHANVDNGTSGNVVTRYASTDTTKPVITITAPTDGVKTNSPAATIVGTATDNETLASGIREVKISLNGGQVYLNDAQDDVSFSQAVTLTDGDNTITVEAKDFAGNAESMTIHVILDTSAPTVSIDSALQGGAELLVSKGSTINAVQGDVTITVNASDTGTSGLVTPPVVTVTPNGGSPQTLTASGSGPWTYVYTVGSGTPNGVATISASVSDEAGNSASDTDTFSINKNQVTGQIELQGFLGASRAVTFVATGGTAKSWTITVSGFSGGLAGYTLTDVPAGTTGISAKTAWNLRRKVGMTLDADGQATGVHFAGTTKLLGGDINGDNFVNILDYSALKNNWFTTNSVADINGDGQVQVLDYGLLQSNFFSRGNVE
jgi:hypothetical protein